MTVRNDRDRLEQLQAEIRALEVQRDELPHRLAEAKRLRVEAQQRELSALLSFKGTPFFRWAPVARLGLDALRFGLISIAVIAVFGAVLGTVTFAIHRHNQQLVRGMQR